MPHSACAIIPNEEPEAGLHASSGRAFSKAPLVRTGLFVAVAFYAWGMIRLLERHRTGLPRELAVLNGHHEETR
jgi:hypothetical protein